MQVSPGFAPVLGNAKSLLIATSCRSKVRPAIFASMFLSVFLTEGAYAQTQFTRLLVFGDSYADNGNFKNIPFTNSAYPSTGQSPSVSAASNPFVVYPVWLQSLQGMSNSQVQNYAIGGSTTEVMNVLGIPFSLPYELTRFSGQTIGRNDLVTLSIGGNDGLLASGALLAQYGVGPNGTAFGTPQAVALANAVTANASGAVKQLVAAGARNFVIAGFSDLSPLPLAAVVPQQASLSVYGQNYFTGLQSALAPLAPSGVRIFLFDDARFARQVGANLGAYGFQSYVNNPAVSSLFMPDGVHLTSAGFLLMARYMNNLLAAPDTVAAQADLGQVALNNFSGSIFQRLDANRAVNGRSAYDAIPSPGFYRKAQAAPAVEQPLTVYMSGDYASGTRNDRYGATGFNYQLAGGTVGADYKVDPHLTIGAAFNYLNPTSNLSFGSGHINVDAYQFGGYASVNFPSWYTDLVVAYGRDRYRFDRPGIMDPVNGTTGGNSFSAAFKGGYLFDLASLRMGPIIGLNYTSTSVSPYTEAGDPLLTFRVSQSNLQSLIGSAGIQVRTSFSVGSTVLNPYLNLTAEHGFLGGDRTLLSIETQAPLLPIYTNVAGFGEAIYGQVAAGITSQFSDRLSGGVSLASTFARESGNAFAVNGQLKWAF